MFFKEVSAYKAAHVLYSKNSNIVKNYYNLNLMYLT